MPNQSALNAYSQKTSERVRAADYIQNCKTFSATYVQVYPSIKIMPISAAYIQWSANINNNANAISDSMPNIQVAAGTEGDNRTTSAAGTHMQIRIRPSSPVHVGCI